MKYKIKDVNIPQNKRKDINDKILHIIDNNINTNISKEDVFNCYTGDGGLHGLKFNEYNNFYDYTQSKKELENGQFFTPHTICKFMVDCIKPAKHDVIADLTCGIGNFFNYLPIEQNIYGCEFDIKAYKVCKYLYPESNIVTEDIRYYNSDIKFDIIFGNPPYNLKWQVGKEEYLSQLYYCIKSNELLKPAGFMILLTPNSFLADEFIDGNIIKNINSMFNFVCQFDLPSNTFKYLGVNNFQTKIMLFQKKSEYLKDKMYTVNKITAPPLTEEGSEYIYNSYVKNLIEEKEKIKSKLFFENLHSSNKDQNFQYKVKKYLFDVKCNPKIFQYYSKCLEYVNKYYTQEKPKDMKWPDWEKIKVTKNKVLGYLKRTLQKQNEKQKDEIRLVKTDYGMQLKAYSNKTKKVLNKQNIIKKISFNNMIINNQYSFEDRKYFQVFKRKQKEYEQQQGNLKELNHTKSIGDFLDEFSIIDYSTKEIIKLNQKQKDDLNKTFQKRYSILNWQQGSGKTVAGIAWYKYLFQTSNIKNAFVVSAAVSINLTWEERLKDYKENYIKIKSLQDINNIKPGQIIIISFNMINKYQKHIKKFVKQQSQKIALIVDESDEMTNHNSKRTKTTLNCFRKAKYKLLTTGTTTRNNINELYSQLELLYNNSVNMICNCKYIYKYNKEKELEEKNNPYYMKPFPAYYGNGLFKSCFSPNKTTVFGVNKQNQDIYNIDHLQEIIEKTIITRKFKEIVGTKIYEVINHKVYQNSAEREIYFTLMQEFYKMQHYFKSTGNTRKDSMLKIIRQIQLLIKSTSTPHLFKEYSSSQLPNKYYKIFDLLVKFKNEKVAIGTVFLDTATSYYSKLKELFSERQIFLIKGDVSFNNRKDIIKEFEATKNGILISTQQSLKASVNIPTCNKVIIESMQWNVPKIEQYYFRFIRYNSKNFKEVHFVTYDHTIEQNLLALLMAKERINEYIKTLEYKEQADIFEEYGIDLDILNNIIEKEKDEEGRVRLTWGNQNIN